MKRVFKKKIVPGILMQLLNSVKSLNCAKMVIVRKLTIVQDCVHLQHVSA